MSTRSVRAVLMVLPLTAIVIAASVLVSGQSGTASGEWPHWGKDLANNKYSPLDQINRDNVKNLRIAWRWKTENFGPRPQNNMEATPLMVGGTLYFTSGGKGSQAILSAAEEWPADLVVLGARGLGAMAGFLLGSVSLGVARHARCSVLVVKGGAVCTDRRPK